MTYANQSSGILPLPGENPELLFSEADRRAAYLDKENGTSYSIPRLAELAERGNSVQAEILLKKLGFSPQLDVV